MLHPATKSEITSIDKVQLQMQSPMEVVLEQTKPLSIYTVSQKKRGVELFVITSSTVNRF